MSGFAAGNWFVTTVPPGWEVMPGYGLRRAQAGAFPSVFLLAQEALAPATTLEGYIARQLAAAKILLREPKIREAVPVSIPDAVEARQIGLSYRSQDGRQVFQVQIYATHANIVGNATFTTIEEELPQVADTLRGLISQLRFGAVPADRAG
jgi:hypothetical protein